MLAFDLHLPEAARGWRWDPDCRRWVSPTGWIQPLDHPALESTLLRDSARVVVVVRERRTHAGPITPPRLTPTRPERTEALLTQMRSWSEEHLTVQLEPGRVQLQAGAYGTAPIYLTLDGRGQRACGSWDLPALRPYLHVDRLCDRAVARALTRHPGYSSDTLFQDVYRLTERASATITPTGGVKIAYPPAALHVTRPRRLRPDADPIDALEALLTAAVARLPVPARLVGVELSGGVDSANVTVSVAALHPHPASYGLLFGEKTGAYQQHRRQTLTRTLGLRDVTIHAPDHLPFAPGGARSRPHDPLGDYYLEAVDAAAGHAAAATGMRVVCTGIGGDELVALRPSEHPTPPPATHLRPPWLGARTLAALGEMEHNLAPAAPLHLPTLVACLVRNPPLVQHGLWPVSPLATSELVRLGESLPVEWRRDKRLLRQRLQRAGLPKHVTHPPPQERETFAELMQRGLRRHGLTLLKGMLNDSVLVDAGHIKPRRVACRLGAGPVCRHDPVATGRCDRAGSRPPNPQLTTPPQRIHDGGPPGRQPAVPLPRAV